MSKTKIEKLKEFHDTYKKCYQPSAFLVTFGREVLSYCKCKNTKLYIYSEPLKETKTVGFAVKELDSIVINPSFVEKLYNQEFLTILHFFMHEIGHLKGLEHDESNIIMKSTIKLK